MATDKIIFADSFSVYSQSSDLSGLGKYISQYNVVWANNTGRFGGPGVYFAANNSDLIVPLATNPTAFVIGMAVNLNGSGVTLFTIFSPLGSELIIQYNAAGSNIEVYNSSSVLVFSGPALSGFTNVWKYLELYIVLDTDFDGIHNGQCWIQINGAIYGSPVEIDGATAPRGGTSYSKFNIGDSNNGIGGYISDLYVRDVSGTSPTLYGDVRVQLDTPNADAGPNNGSPLSGSNHYAAVDAIPYSTSNYITMTNTSGQEELYDTTPLTGSPATIYGVQVTLVAEKTDAGAASLETLISSSGTTATGASVALNAGWAMQSDIFMVDPHTSAAWTTSAVNALKVGYIVP